MKRGFIAAGLIAIMFSSCKKEEYVCKCVINYGGGISTRKYELGKITNGTAQSKCNKLQEDAQNNGRLGVYSCKVELDQ